MKKDMKNNGKRIAFAAILVGAVLCLLTFLFIQSVKTQLWDQSVNTITEATRQGCNTLKIQLQDDNMTLDTVAERLKEYSKQDTGELEAMLRYLRRLESGVSLYLEDGSCIPEDPQKDETAADILFKKNIKSGIVDPHISSATGVNVFNQFVEVTMKDGTKGFLTKEYETDSIADSFSLSFYNNAGFSYVVNIRGDVLIRSPHPNSNKTVNNLFDMLEASDNNAESLKQFSNSLKELRTGWAVFDYHGEETVFCYTPLNQGSDWYLVSIIPQNVVSAQTNEILQRSLGLIVCIIVGILLLVLVYFRYMKKINKKLRNQVEYTGHLYNAVPEAVALITVERPHRFIQLNKEGLKLLDYPETASNDAPAGRALEDLIHPEDYEKMKELFKNTAVSSRKTVLENRIVKADGSFMWVSGIIEKTLDENGLPVLIAAFHDVTDEKLSKEAAEREKLQERLTLVSAISNAYPVIINLNLTKDKLRFVYIKKGLMLRLGEQDTYTGLYENMAVTIHPDHLKDFRLRLSPENLRRTLGQDKKEIFLEARQMLTDGQYHWISTQIIYVDNPYSEDKLAILISRRIDEQRHEEEQQRQALHTALVNARAASDAKSQFLSNMSHDIRTPMNAIIGMTSIAEAHLNDSKWVLDCLKKIKLSGNHLLSLINDVLDMSKIESGKLSLREEQLNLSVLTAETVELLRTQAEEKQIKLSLSPPALENENVMGDTLRIRQIFINILSNAVKYTQNGGSIQVELKEENSARREYQSYIFRCEDTGIGMDKEFLEKLFLPFERAQEYTDNTAGGTGLGMAITKNLADMMNGDLLVESRPDKGSVFTVILPLRVCGDIESGNADVQALSRIEQEEAGFPEVRPDYTDKHVLLAEDNEINREIARELIGELGFIIEEACNGREAVEKAASSSDRHYDLILMDIQMPKMNGYEAAKAIRALDREDMKEIPIIAMTANAFEEDVREALRAGMNAHVAKPVDMAELERLLYEYVGGN